MQKFGMSWLKLNEMQNNLRLFFLELAKFTFTLMKTINDSRKGGFAMAVKKSVMEKIGNLNKLTKGLNMDDYIWKPGARECTELEKIVLVGSGAKLIELMDKFNAPAEDMAKFAKYYSVLLEDVVHNKKMDIGKAREDFGITDLMYDYAAVDLI